MATSCKHDNDPVVPEPNPPGSIAPTFEGVRWQLSNMVLDPAVDIDGDGRVDSDITNLFLRPCDLDNTLVFERGGNVSGDKGKLRCDDDDPTPTGKSARWTYDSAAKQLRIVDGTEVTEWVVLEASASYLKVKQQFTEEGKTYLIVMTWKKA